MTSLDFDIYVGTTSGELIHFIKTSPLNVKHYVLASKKYFNEPNYTEGYFDFIVEIEILNVGKKQIPFNKEDNKEEVVDKFLKLHGY